MRQRISAEEKDLFLEKSLLWKFLGLSIYNVFALDEQMTFTCCEGLSCGRPRLACNLLV